MRDNFIKTLSYLTFPVLFLKLELCSIHIIDEKEEDKDSVDQTDYFVLNLGQKLLEKCEVFVQDLKNREEQVLEALFEEFSQFFRFETTNREIKHSRLVTHFSTLLFGVSAGTYAALISWFQGYQYTREKRSRSHHINPYRPLRFFVSPLRQYCHSWRTRGFNLTNLSISLRTFVRSEGNTSASTLDRLSSVVKDIESRRKRIGKYDFSAPNSRDKGDQETFRRGALVRAEILKDRYRNWDSSGAYKIHPYWSFNLKYAR